jgi:2,3-dimethylmalate lyase
MSDHERRKAFRRMLHELPVVVAPGAHDALTAKIIERAGFPAVYMSGSGIANTVFGVPDIGLVTMTEMTTLTRNFAEAVSIPIIADADVGYGNAINVARAVREFERAGAVAIHIEDEDLPKRRSGLKVKSVISDVEMVGKIKAALDARRDPEFMVIARTDSYGGGGIAEAVRRCRLYSEAGADMVFPTGIRLREDMERLRQDAPGLKLFNMGGYSPAADLKPRLPFEEIGDLGFKLVILPMAAARAGARAVWDLLHGIKRDGPAFEEAYIQGLKGHPMEDWYAFTGLRDIEVVENRYLPAADPEA